MKIITSPLLRFVLISAILTVLFRYVLSYGIEHQLTAVIILAAVIYGVLLFITGWYLGMSDAQYLPILDVGFRFHLTTYVVHVGISELWFLSGSNSSLKHISTVHLTAIIWGSFLLIHFIIFMVVHKKSIRGLDRSELFE